MRNRRRNLARTCLNSAGHLGEAYRFQPHASCSALTPKSPFAGEDCCTFVFATWILLPIQTHCRIPRRKGLRRMHPRQRARSARNIHLQRGMYEKTASALPSLTSKSNECKRCKVKCIRVGDNIDCQRCSNAKVACIVIPTATQSAKEKDRNKVQNSPEE